MVRIRDGVGVVCLLAMCVALAAASQIMSVQVKNGQIRKSPSFLGDVLATANYGEQVEVTAQQGAWMQVRKTGGVAGWMHQSALTRKPIVMNSGGAPVATGASGDELALAGKGFNADVEAKFRAENKMLDYATVDRMERQKVSPQDIRGFLIEGGLVEEGGGR